jgi:serine/threonine protein kinase
MGLAALHNFDVEGVPSAVHNDISPNQFVKVGNTFRLNDFNRARLLTKNVQTGQVCPYHEGTNRGKNRSPEEYAYQPQTAMVDLYSLGNIFYMLLMQNYPFRNAPSWRKAAEWVQDGQRPHVFPHVWNSTHPVDVALKQAMVMCHAQEPEDRATARQVERYLQGELQRLDPGRLESWGVKAPQ